MLTMESLETAKETLMAVLCYDGYAAPDLKDEPINALAIATAFILGAFVLDPADVDAPDSPERTAKMQSAVDAIMLVTENSGAVEGVPQNFDDIDTLSKQIVDTLYGKMMEDLKPSE